MTSEAELGQVIETAYLHCRPGGVAVFVPGSTTETFLPGTGYGGVDGPDGRGARFLEWAFDPDPDDTWTQSEYAFMLRDASGAVQVVHETHRLGLFGHETWLSLIAVPGFEPRVVAGETAGDQLSRELFAGRRPGAWGPPRGRPPGVPLCGCRGEGADPGGGGADGIRGGTGSRRAS